MSLNILVVIEKNSWVDFHIADSLAILGHNVHRFYFGEYVGEFYGARRFEERVKKNKELVETAAVLVEQKRLDLIFCYIYDDFLLPKYAKALEKLALPMVNYNVDMPFQWYRQIKTAKFFTCMLCAQPDHMGDLGRYANKTFYFPMAARVGVTNESILFKGPKKPVTFLGSPLALRTRLLAELINASIPLEIYGRSWKERKTITFDRNFEKICSDIFQYGWPRLKSEGMHTLLEVLAERFKPIDEMSELGLPYTVIQGPLLNEEISQLFRKSKINIGLTRIAGNDLNKPGRCQMKLRDFEVPMAGGFYLVEKAPGYEIAFKEDSEVVTWKTLPELKEKIHYYLEHDVERNEIAQRGKSRAVKEHSWSSRFNMLFKEIGIKNPITLNGEGNVTK